MHRRRTDLHLIRNRRSENRASRVAVHVMPHIRFPSFREQVTQFLTRYLFAILGLIFFNFSPEAMPTWLPLQQLNIVFFIYLGVNTINWIHAWYHDRSPSRYRLALLIDIAMVTIAVANDPNVIPPSMVAYIVVVLGNGMRYGIRLFAEALVATMIGAAISMGVRYWHLSNVVSQGTVFLALFGGFIIVYSYVLMGRIERSRQHSEQRSRTDPLTGLLNRHGLTEAVEQWMTDKQWCTRKPVVVLADLDNFKTINDTSGHAEGDRVLTQVANMLEKTLRSNDLIARYGGDEFIVLLADAELSEAQLIVSRIQMVVESWFRTNNLECGISIGFGAASTEQWNLDGALQAVDRMLYESKASRGASGNRVVSARSVAEQ